MMISRTLMKRADTQIGKGIWKMTTLLNLLAAESNYIWSLNIQPKLHLNFYNVTIKARSLVH